MDDAGGSQSDDAMVLVEDPVGVQESGSAVRMAATSAESCYFVEKNKLNGGVSSSPSVQILRHHLIIGIIIQPDVPVADAKSLESREVED